jgi:hypothetical protein
MTSVSGKGLNMHNDDTSDTPDGRLTQHWSDYLASLVIASARKEENYAACEHPRIALLRREVLALPLSDEKKLSLLQSIEVFRDELTAGRKVAQLWCHHRDGSKTYVETRDLEWLIVHLPEKAGELGSNQIGKDCSTPHAGLPPPQIKNNEKKRPSTWHHPTLGLVELLMTIPGSGNAKVRTLTNGKLYGVGISEAGNIYYVDREQLSVL